MNENRQTGYVLRLYSQPADTTIQNNHTYTEKIRATGQAAEVTHADHW